MNVKAISPLASPCIKICTVDAQSQLCVGCLRTLAEIGGWSRLTGEQRQAIMTALPGRAALLADTGHAEDA